MHVKTINELNFAAEIEVFGWYLMVLVPIAVIGSQSSKRPFGNWFSEESWLCPHDQTAIAGHLL